MNANGTGKRRLMDDTAVDRQPSWSPDGSLITFVSDRIDNPSGPDADIFTVPAAGGAITPLSTGLFTEDPGLGPARFVQARALRQRHPWHPGGRGARGHERR